MECECSKVHKVSSSRVRHDRSATDSAVVMIRVRSRVNWYGYSQLHFKAQHDTCATSGRPLQNEPTRPVLRRLMQIGGARTHIGCQQQRLLP